MTLTDHVAEAIDRWHEEHREGPRSHIGCSIAGDECARKIWLQFRLAVKPKHEGRILRLFQRGRDEERSVYTNLERIGCTVTDTQTRVDFGSGVSGSIDGIVTGVPYAEKTRHLLEIKTHSKKSFDQLEKDGVQTAKPLHYAQMQLYMLGLGLDRALYFAVCKDDDRIWTERVKLDRSEAERIRDRAISIALANEAPPRLSNDPSFYLCKMCDQRTACFEQSDWVNCRTCAHSTHTAEDRWICEKWGALEIPSLEAQLTACDSHVMHPHVVPSWERLESIGEWAAPYRLPDGREVINGDPSELEGCTTSRELIGENK